MERYSVFVSDSSSSEALKLLVPFRPSARTAALIDEIVRRACRFGRTLMAADCVLHLESADGLILDPDDVLSDLVFGEQLCAVFTDKAAEPSQAALLVHGRIPVRIITPAIAKMAAKDAKSLPAPAFSLPASAKLQEVHDAAVRHISTTTPDWLMTPPVLDLHTHELPIASACFESSLQETGLAASLNDDGILVIFAVPRPASEPRLTTLTQDVRVGMNDVFSAGPHWQPEIPQKERGVAMFLSSLRVFTHNVKGSNTAATLRNDRMLYLFDLMCRFPPAVRALGLLMQGKVITPSASAALSHAFYHILIDMVPRELIEHDNARVLEGTRLFLGLLSDKVKHPKLQQGLGVPEYTSRIRTVTLHANSTGQVSVPLGHGLIGNRHFEIEEDDGQDCTLKLSIMSENNQKATLFCQSHVHSSSFPHTLTDLVVPEEMHKLHHLANMCGRASLTVLRPSTLSSVAPEHLTFDQMGNVAVYTGRAGCASPGEDIVIFRPAHGESTPNIGHVEQQLAPFLHKHEADGTNVFDALGSSESRALESPDEIIVFAVDCSASMSSSSNLVGVEEQVSHQRVVEVEPVISPHVYNRANLADTKTALSEHDVYDDLLATVAQTTNAARSLVAIKMLAFVHDLIAREIETNRHLAATVGRLVLDRLELFSAGIKRFEQELVDMIILAAMSMPPQQWTWAAGQPIPGRMQMQPLPAHVTQVPFSLRCPISLEVFQDPVIAADGQIYSRPAMTRWLQIRKSSPMTGLMLTSTELRPHLALAQQADKWIQAEDVISPEDRPVTKRRRTSRETINISFSGPSHIFSRDVLPSLSVNDLYKVAFRGMRGKFDRFKLSLHRGQTDKQLMPSDSTIFDEGFGETSTIIIGLEAQNSLQDPGQSSLCLVKVFWGHEKPLFSYWVPQDTTSTLASILGKYLRFRLSSTPRFEYKECEIWTDLVHHGDSHLRGNVCGSGTPLSSHLTHSRAHGILGAEPVQRVDASPSTALESSDGDEDEEPSHLVLKVLVADRSTSTNRERRLSRLEVLKQMFEAMINRIIAYSYKTHIGLVTFTTTPKVSQSITHVIENFRKSVSSMSADGDTALWDGLKLAQAQIMEYSKKYPQAQRRIICLSDGNDNKSTAGPADLSWQLRQDKIVVDSICIGEENNLDLRALSNILGSYCFYPTDLTTALAICELEPVLSQTDRPSIISTMPTQRTSGLNSFYTARHRATFTTVTQDVFPKRKEHPRMRDSFILLIDCVRAGAGRVNNLPTFRNSRILVEMREMAAKPNPKYDCYVSETEMSFWKVVVEGPPDTPYEGCSFMLYLEMPENFPIFPPKGRFVTPLFHPNINRHGRICHSIFDRDWTTDTSLKSVLDTVYGLLLHAETGDAVHTTVTLGFHHDQDAFADEARRHAGKHGTKTRLEWMIELLELEEEDEEGVDEEGMSEEEMSEEEMDDVDDDEEV